MEPRDLLEGRGRSGRGGIFVGRTDGEALGDAFLLLRVFRFPLQPVPEFGLALQERAPEAGFGEDGPVGEGEGAALEGGDDGVAHVADEDRHGGDGDEGPDDEEWFPRVGHGGEVAVADGDEGDEAEVEGFEVGEALGFLFGTPETDGADAPEEADCEGGKPTFVICNRMAICAGSCFKLL